MAVTSAARTGNVGRPKKVSREQIIAAALEVMEESGFSALTIRGLARHLGVNHATLYNYVEHIGEIEQEALDHLMTRIPMPDPEKPEPLRQQLIEHLLGVRRVQILFPKFCYAPAGTPAWRVHMSAVAHVLKTCTDSDEQIEDMAIAYNALIGLIATSAERARVTGGLIPIKADLEAMAALPRDEFEPLFRPLVRFGGYSKRLSSFVYRLDYLITRLAPHLQALDPSQLDELERRFNSESGP